tara:strand:- start:1738 stop:2535 length:798 start_codon:yes stop_codon:yes gene_type:complete
MTENKYNLSGKNVLICGGLGWLGSHYSKGILNSSDAIFILDNDDLDAYKDFFTEKELEKIVYQKVDFYNHEKFKTTLRKIIKDNHINCLINNAFDFSSNTGFGEKIDFIESKINHWEKTADSGMIWPLISCREILRNRNKVNHISIINIASMYALIAPNPNNYLDNDSFMLPQYGMVKSSIINLTKYLASYYGAEGLRINSIAPGAFPKKDKLNNDFGEKLIKNIPLERLGEPEDLVGLVLFLLSNDSSYITGQTFTVDGGWTIR